jgi:3-carboxy-cis,cis-muconate cycloisomerase
MGDMTDAPMSSHLMTPLHASPAMRALLSDRARLQRMLDFEAALARAEAAVGVIGATGAAVISQACDAAHYDIPALIEAQASSGDLAAAVVAALTQQVAARDQAAANFVHWGAGSQDVIDTALMLELRNVIDALVADLDLAIKGFVALAGRHRRTLSVARTAMRHAAPMPFGLKLAGYAAALGRSRDRLTRLRREALVLQFGGAAGTLAALGEQGMPVSERLAALLDLGLADAPWHTHRDRLAEMAACFGILAGTCGKIARDVMLMMQTEVGEASVPRRDGAAAALSAATAAPNLVATLLAAQVQEHEQAQGTWHTDWMTFPALAMVTSGALAAVVDIAQGLEVDVDRLRANLELTGGRIMAEAVSFALAEKIGRAEAQALVKELTEQATQEKRPLKEALLRDIRVKSQLGGTEIEKLFIPLTYQGSAQTFIERLVVASQMRGSRRAEPRTETRPETRTEPKPEPLPAEPAVKLAAAEPPSPPALQTPPPPASPPPSSDKLQWSGTLMHIFTNAAEAPPGAPPDQDKLKLP